jgi:D-inositol-3-phosphate glycosyltransferase
MSKVAILTGGRDTYYAIPLAEGLAQQPSLAVDVIASTQYLGAPGLVRHHVPILTLHGDLTPGKSRLEKLVRTVKMYAGILAYSVRTDAKIFHILWENQFKLLDRTLLVAFYKLLGKKIVFTAHNVDADERDARGNALGRLSLRVMYAMADHVFVHTERMKQQIAQRFAVEPQNITVIPFGMNTVMPKAGVTSEDARRQLGCTGAEKLVLFFGNITLYKGVEYLVESLAILKRRGAADIKLIVAGNVKDRHSQSYWQDVKSRIAAEGLTGTVRIEARFIRDDEVELFFKAADVCVLPYVTIDQSGVLILSYRYGTPVIVSDVGSMREDVVHGQTGFVCRPRDAEHLAATIDAYFSSALFTERDRARAEIEAWADARYSWRPIAGTIADVYSHLVVPRAVRSQDPAR